MRRRCDPTRNGRYQLRVPRSPLSNNSDFYPVRLDEVELRKIFVDRIWKKYLYPAIGTAISRAKSELEGQAISVVLMSGGSANIKWLHKLLDEASVADLRHAEVLQLQEDFQEIVAKGLAIECARKTFNQGDGDFRAVTYNRLCLVLNPDDRGAEIVQFQPSDSDLPRNMVPGVLLPSASIIEAYLGKPLTWKFRLSHPPKRQLDYFFMSSSFDPDELDSVHNVVDHSVTTPKNATFDRRIELSVVVAEDGTARPKFVYRSEGPNIPECGAEDRSILLRHHA